MMLLVVLVVVVLLLAVFPSGSGLGLGSGFGLWSGSRLRRTSSWSSEGAGAWQGGFRRAAWVLGLPVWGSLGLQQPGVRQ